MFCPKCGANCEGKTFCTNCGTRLDSNAQFQPPQQPIYNQTQSTPTGNLSLVFGLLSMILWIIPILGLPASIIGLVSGIRAKINGAGGAAVAGIVLASMGLLATIINAVVGATLGANGLLY